VQIVQKTSANAQTTLKKTKYMSKIVANHDCIYWLYLYGPDPLCPYLFLFYTLHPPRKLPFSGQCERLSRRLVILVVTHQEKDNFYIVMECDAIYIGRTFNIYMVTPSNNNNNNNDFIAESIKMALPLQIYLKLSNPDNMYYLKHE
jgi:hypothetical protein